MKALVTGAGGFLGLYIVERLVARGDQVRAFCRGAYRRLEQLGVETVRGDVRRRGDLIAACRGVDVVFHTAAIAGIGGRWQDFYQTNVVGTRNVIEGCRQQGVGRLIYTSSPSVTFDAADQTGVDERAPYAQRFLAHYPRSKAIAEREVLAADGRGLLCCAIRPHLIWGPRDRHLIPRLLARAKAGRLRRVGAGKNLIDMTYVENAADAHLLAADALGPGSRRHPSRSTCDATGITSPSGENASKATNPQRHSPGAMWLAAGSNSAASPEVATSTYSPTSSSSR